MCKVIEEMRKESFEEGKMEGKIEGKMEGKIEGKMEGKIEGKMEGKIEGKMEGIKLVAQSMLETGRYALEEIANLSGLSLEEVKDL